MRYKKYLLVFITVLIGVFLFSLPTVSSSALSAEPKPSSQQTQALEDQIENAVLEAVASSNNYIQGGVQADLQVTEIKVSPDQQWATAWVVYYDPQIQAVLPTEPALSVVQLIDGQWMALLPTDPGWQDAINSVPDDLLPPDEKEMWLAMNQGTVEASTTQTGYYLPYHGGLTGYLSRSVGHDADFTTAHYAFDFFFPGSTVCTSGASSTLAGTEGFNFNIQASRAGTVWGWDDSVTDCDHNKVNFIVLRNIDDPSIFQLYMHLSKGSIPAELKTVGAPVAKGQFIAVADNTGNSTGSHLHFQIEHQPYWPGDNPYWNTALPMTFDDVDINGGRPRVNPLDGPYCHSDDYCYVFRSTYVSGNYYLGDAYPPTGGLTGVSEGENVTRQTVTLSGWGADDRSGLNFGQLVANFNGSWQNLGPQFNPTFTYSWDLCDPSVPVDNGPISVALVLYDIAGNPAPRVGLTHFVKNYSCPIPPPSCTPDANQVTLFEDPYYRGGCVKFGVGDYPTGNSLDPLGNNDADSIMVGANVIATLYSDDQYSGHSQAITKDIAYLQYEWVPGGTLSSMQISSRATPPLTPVTVMPVQSFQFRAGDDIPFSWGNGGGAIEYKLQIYKDATLVLDYPWQPDPVRYVESLTEGAYSWRVQARNAAGESPWTAKSGFSVASPIIFPPVETVPYSDTMENHESSWAHDGLWNFLSDAGNAHSGVNSWWYQNSLGNYDNGQPNWGSLTSPPFNITAPGYFLRFYYRYQTETTGPTWDQRWVQISVDQGPFINLVQLVDDPQIPETTSWMRNKAINLTAYSGHKIRIRFLFASLDAVANNFPGWGIDDFSIASIPPASCNDVRQDESPDQAYFLAYDPSIKLSSEICPNGDYDFYKFYGNAGDHIVADIDAMVDGSPLDSYLYLLDTDGKTVLAENDDQEYAVRRDPLLTYTLPKAGTYFLKLKAWKHPLVGGQGYSYSIRLYEDHMTPGEEITWPVSDTYLPDTDMVLTANVNEVTNGVDRVEFFWHPTNWISGAWQKLGTDYDGSDGWSMAFSPAGQVEGNDAAVFIQTIDKAGNSMGKASWDLGIDKTPPTTSMTPLAATQPSNAFLLGWTGSDNLSGIDYVEIQEKVGQGSWTTFPPIGGSDMQYWIIGQPGNTYFYRMHSVDRSGNSEIYSADAEVNTSIPAADVICFARDSYDTSGNDNSPANASVIFTNGAGQYHNFCNPLRTDHQNDEDWTKLAVVQGERYLIRNSAKSQPAATVISLFAQDGTTLLAEAIPSRFGADTVLVWTADRDGEVYLRLRHQDSRVIGNDVGGTLSVKTGLWFYLPNIYFNTSH
jgi:hypothetical protein